MVLHKQVWPGKRVIVHLVDGTSFVDKFVESRRDKAIFETRTETYKNIRSMTIYKQQGKVQDP